MSCKVPVSDMPLAPKFMKLGNKTICIQRYGSGYYQTNYTKYPTQRNHDSPRISQYISTVDTSSQDETHLKPWIYRLKTQKNKNKNKIKNELKKDKI